MKMSTRVSALSLARVLVVSLIAALPATAWGAWVIVADEDYETGTASGWSDNTVTDSGHVDYTEFLGQFSQVGGQGVYKTFSGLPGGSSQVNVQFDLYRIDSWDTENFRVYIDDTLVADHTYGTAAPTGVTLLGGGSNEVFYGWTDYRYRYEFDVTGSGADIKLGFGDSLSSPITDESWGIDNLLISYNVASSTGDRTWNSTATADWTSVTNWDDGTPPPSGTLAAPPTVYENAYVPAGTVNVTTAEMAYSLDIGNTLPTGNPIVDVNSGAALTVADATSIGGTGTLDVNGTFVTGTISSVAGSDVNLNNGGSLTTGGGTIDKLTVSGTATLDGNGVTITNLNMNSLLNAGSDFTATNTVLNSSSTINQTTGIVTLGNISGTGGLTLNGSGTVSLPTANTYAGDTTIGSGITVVMGNNASLGNEAAGTVIQSGGTLDIQGFRAGANGNELVEVQGTGVGGQGAIINTGGSQTSAFRRITMTGDATFRADNRWDMRNTGGAATFDMNGHTLTKVGSSEFVLVSTTINNPGSVNVNQGLFRIEGSTQYGGSGTISLAGGTALDFYANTQSHSPNITLADNTNLTVSGGGSGPTLTGTITLNGTANIATNTGPLTLDGQVTGSGGFAKSGDNVLTLNSNASDFSGPVSVTAGTLRIAASNALGSTAGSTSLTGGASLELQGNISVPAEALSLGSVTSSGESIVNLSGDNRFDGDILLGPATYYTASSATIDSQAGSLTLGGNIDMNYSDLTVNGAGNTVIEGSITGTNTTTTISMAGLLAGSHSNSNWQNDTNPGNLGISASGPLGMIRDGRLGDIRESHWGSSHGDDGASGPDNTALIYTGQVYLTPGDWTFAEQNDDNTFVRVGGSTIINAGTWNDANRGMFTATLDDGSGGAWYDFEARFQNGGGGYGFFGQQNTGAGDSNWDQIGNSDTDPDGISGFRYASGNIGDENALSYNDALDPGDGSLFQYVLNASPNGLTKNDAGTLTLSGDNSYVGLTTVNGGTLKLGHLNALGATGAGNGTVINSGATLDLGGAYSAANSSEAITVSGDGVGGLGAIVNTGAGIVNRGFGNVTLAGDTTFGGSNRFDLRSGTTVTGNNHTLTKAGSFQMAVSGAINDADIVIDGGSITIQNSNALGGTTYGTTTVNAGATLNYYGAYTVPETIIMNGGTLGSLNNDTTFSGPVTLNADVTMSTNSGGHDMTLSGVIDGAGGITKTGGSSLILTADNTYTGTTTINDGTIVANNTNGGGDGVFESNTDVVINTGGTLQLNNSDAVGYHTGNPVFKINGGTVTTDTTTGHHSIGEYGIEMTGGTLTSQGTGGAGYKYIIDGTISTKASANTSTISAHAINIRDGGTFDVEDGTATTDLLVSSVVSGSAVTKDGDGTMTLSAANTFSGGTTVNGGTLKLGAGGSVGTIRGTLTVNPGAAVAYTVSNAFGYIGGQSVNVLNINDATVGGTNHGNHFWNNFQLNMTGGTLHLGGTLNEFHNPTITVNNFAETAQILAVTSSAVLRLRNGTSAVFNVADGAQDVDLLVDVPITFQHTSGIAKNGAGTMELTQASTYTGATVINDGTLLVNGSIASPVNVNGGTLGGDGSIGGLVTVNTGTLAPGNSPGILTLQNGVSLSAGSTFEVEIDGTSPGVGGYDQLLVTGGDVSLGGATLDIILGYYPTVTDSFTIIDNEGPNSVIGTFDGLGEGDHFYSDYLGSYRQFAITYFGGTGNDVVLTAVPEPSTLAMLLGLGSLGLLGYRWRRRSN